MNIARQANHHAPHSNLTEMYPGNTSGDLGEDHNGTNLPIGFELETYQTPRDQLLTSKVAPDGVISTHKYR